MISIRHIGGDPASIIEMTITDGDTTIVTDVTDVRSMVAQDLIDNLREIAEELEAHNEKFKPIKPEP